MNFRLSFVVLTICTAVRLRLVHYTLNNYTQTVSTTNESLKLVIILLYIYGGPR